MGVITAMKRISSQLGLEGGGHLLDPSGDPVGQGAKISLRAGG